MGMDGNQADRQGESVMTGGLQNRGVKKQGSAVRPLVSVITAVLNNEDSIRKTIESVLRQSYSPIEYIIIDGGSTDNTLSIIRSHDDAIDYWISEPDRGISDAFNKGIRAAQGEYIGLINAGDWYEPSTVERVVDTFLASPGTGVVCGALQYWHGEEKGYVCQSEPRLLDKDMTVTHPTCFIRADCYDRFGLYEEAYSYAMDYKLLLRLKLEGVGILGLRTVLANMQHAGISESNWKAALQETHRARKELMGRSLFTTKGYYLFLETKRRLRIFMEKVGWDGPVAFYRSRLALVKKSRPGRS